MMALLKDKLVVSIIFHFHPYLPGEMILYSIWLAHIISNVLSWHHQLEDH